MNRNEFKASNKDSDYGHSFSTCFYPFHIAALVYNNGSKRKSNENNIFSVIDEFCGFGHIYWRNP